MNEKSKLKKDLEKIQYYDGHTPANHRIDDLVYIVSDLVDVVESQERIFNKEQLPLKAAPFQPECKCDAWQRRHDGKLIIQHCQYHRGIAYVHDELIAISKLMEREYLIAGRELIIDLLSFLDDCKNNSLTGKIGKARDENVGR